jgi:putative ABC transport system permease protein
MIDIEPLRLLFVYGLLIFPFGVILWFRIGMATQVIVGVIRMTCQLLFVGLYLQFIFDRNSIWLNILWITMMICVADVSVIRGCAYRVKRFCVPLFAAMLIGVSIPLLVFVGLVIDSADILPARYAIPIAGMILGNCLRANIVGIGRFYQDIRQREKPYLMSLAQGATQSEALRPYVRTAIQAALAPTTATMAAMGLVSLPGMMTGVMLGGGDPMPAIKYQIAIMMSIFSSAVITVFLAIVMTAKKSFNGYGVLDKTIFTD